MFDRLLSIVAPHYCCGCGIVGTLLCANCKYNIIDEADSACIICHHPTGQEKLCKNCSAPYDRAWLVGERHGTLQRLVGLFKFERTKAAGNVLANLLSETLPKLPIETVIVPVPTVASHIRERGYDHVALIAKKLAKARDLKYETLLSRATKTKQRHSSATQRETQAQRMFALNKPFDPAKPYLLIDDVMTTGATIKYAAKTLRNAGAKTVWIAIIARQIQNDKL